MWSGYEKGDIISFACPLFMLIPCVLHHPYTNINLPYWQMNNINNNNWHCLLEIYHHVFVCRKINNLKRTTLQLSHAVAYCSRVTINSPPFEQLILRSFKIKIINYPTCSLFADNFDIVLYNNFSMECTTAFFFV